LTEKYQVIISDGRGHGLTTAPAGDNHYSYEIMCDDLLRLMQHLGIEQAIVGGLSMGGGISLTFALKYPERVRALILSDCAGTGVPSPQMTETPEQRASRFTERERVIREYGVVEQARRDIAAGLVARQVLENEKFRSEYLERLSRFSVNGAIYAWRYVMGGVVPGVEHTKNLNIPTLVIIGEEDIACAAGAEWLRDTLPLRRFAFLTEVGHGTSRYKPEAWRKAVENFLNDLERGAAIQAEVVLI